MTSVIFVYLNDVMITENRKNVYYLIQKIEELFLY